MKISIVRKSDLTYVGLWTLVALCDCVIISAAVSFAVLHHKSYWEAALITLMAIAIALVAIVTIRKEKYRPTPNSWLLAVSAGHLLAAAAGLVVAVALIIG